MNCLNDLIKIKEYCADTYKGPKVSDYVDVPLILLAHLANDAESSGAKYGKNLIKSAAEELEADIMLSATDGYSVRDIVYTYNNICTFTNTKASGLGSNIVSNYRSKFAEIVVTGINFKPAFDGDFTIVIDDGINLYEVEAVAVKDTLCNIAFNYISSALQIKIYAKDTSLEFYALNCNGNVTCGSCAAKKGILAVLYGYAPSGTTNSPVGFNPLFYIQCNMDSILCTIINKYQPLFAKALAYKVGIAVYTRLLLSPRLNDSTINIDKDAVTLYLSTLEGKYREIIHGSSQAYGKSASKGILDIIRNSFKLLNDPCITCSSAMFSSTAMF